PHLLRVDSPPPPHRRNPSLAVPERQQVQRPTEVPSRTVRHLPLHHLLQTPIPPRCHPPRPPPRPRCPRQTQGRSRGSAPPPPPPDPTPAIDLPSLNPSPQTTFPQIGFVPPNPSAPPQSAPRSPSPGPNPPV